MRRELFSLFSSFRRVLALYLPAAAAAFALSSFLALPAQVLVRPVNLAYLVQRADIIVQGRVIAVVQEALPGFPNIPTIKVTLDVERMMRGPTTKTYTFREILLGLGSKAGKKDYGVGQQVFLFLPAPSEYGLSSPIGIEQGRFHITPNPAGSSMVVNDSNNLGLFRNVAQAASLAGYPLTASQLKVTAAEGGPVRLDGFVSLVKSLTSMPRIR
jgi:hypothetical protein